MEGKVRKLEKHYIICGFGRFGRTIAEELTRKNVPFVVIETEPSRVAWAMEHDCLIIDVSCDLAMGFPFARPTSPMPSACSAAMTSSSGPPPTAASG